MDPEIGAAGDVDTAAVILTYEDGKIAVIKNSRRAVYGYDQRVELLGSDGLLQAQNMLENTVVKSTKDWCRRGSQPISSLSGICLPI